MNSNSTLVVRYIPVLLIFVTSSFSFVQAGKFSSGKNSVEPQHVSFISFMINDGGFTGQAFSKVGARRCWNTTASDSVKSYGPVRYRIFNGMATGKSQADLLWVTENEKDNDRFEVERSFDKATFKTVALVFGFEQDTTQSHTYYFSDKPAHIKKHRVAYYRLKQIDFSGNIYYSDVIPVFFSTKAEVAHSLSVKVFPNPWEQFLNINFKSAKDGVVLIRLATPNIDAKESIIKKKAIRFADGKIN